MSLGPQTKQELILAPWEATLRWKHTSVSTRDLQMHPSVPRIGFAIDTEGSLRVLLSRNVPKRSLLRRFVEVASVAWLHGSSWIASMPEQAMRGCYEPGDAQNRRSSDGSPNVLQHSSDDVP